MGQTTRLPVLDTIEANSTSSRAIHNSNMEILSKDRLVAGLHASRPAATTDHQYYYSTDTGEVSYANGSSWIPLIPGGLETRVASVTAIAMGSTGTTSLYTVPAAKFFVATKLILMVESTGSAHSAGPTVSLGSNATAYDDILTATPATGFTTTQDVWVVHMAGRFASIGSSGTVRLNVSVAATGGAARTMRADLYGFNIS